MKDRMREKDSHHPHKKTGKKKKKLLVVCGSGGGEVRGWKRLQTKYDERNSTRGSGA
jgi:hypothetical protein